MRSLTGYRVVLEGVGLSVLFWLAVVVYGLVRDGTVWPQATPAIGPPINRAGVSEAEAWESFLWLGLEAELFWLLAYGSARRTQHWSGLAAALSVVMLLFAAVLAYAMLAQIRVWETTIWTRRLILRWPLILASLWAIGELIRIRDPEERA